MKHYIILTAFALFTLTDTYGQTTKHTQVKDVCFGNSNYRNNSVNEFNESLTITVDILEIQNGKVSENVEFSHSEEFANETSLIEINDTVAMKISICRAVDYGVKKYLYKIDLFRKKGKCWNNAGGPGLWAEFYPGQLTEGFSVGTPNTSSYLGFNGSIQLE